MMHWNWDVEERYSLWTINVLELFSPETTVVYAAVGSVDALPEVNFPTISCIRKLLETTKVCLT